MLKVYELDNECFALCFASIHEMEACSPEPEPRHPPSSPGKIGIGIGIDQVRVGIPTSRRSEHLGQISKLYFTNSYIGKLLIIEGSLYIFQQWEGLQHGEVRLTCTYCCKGTDNGRVGLRLL